MTKYLFALLPHVFLVSILTLPMPVQAQIETNRLGETNTENLNREVGELDNEKIDSLNQELNELKDSTENKLLEINKQIKNITNKQNQKGGMFTNPIFLAFIGAVFGTGLGFLSSLRLNNLSNRKKTQGERKSNTIEMWKYWDSVSIRESRFNAWRTYYVFAKDATSESSETESQAIANKLGTKLTKDYDNKNNKDVISVLRVSDFFRTLHYLKGSESIDEELAKYFFQDAYKSWDIFFSEDLKTQLKKSELEGVVSKVRQCNWLK